MEFTDGNKYSMVVDFEIMLNDLNAMDTAIISVENLINHFASREYYDSYDIMDFSFEEYSELVKEVYPTLVKAAMERGFKREQITVVFFVEKPSMWINKPLEKKVIRTGKYTVAEAADVAVANGANPLKNWQLIWEI